MAVLDPVLQLDTDRLTVWETVRDTENVRDAAAVDAAGDRDIVTLFVRDKEVVGQKVDVGVIDHVRACVVMTGVDDPEPYTVMLIVCETLTVRDA